MIIKGGFLLSSLLGIENRSTVDVDFTLQSLAMDESVIRRSLNHIIDIQVEDECNFKITNVSDIRHEDKYDGLRVTILGEFHSLKFHFKLDLSTGDIITPSPVQKTFKLNIIEKNIELFSYNFETVLAEKLQTIISRGIATTRTKDYFDVYTILINQKDMIDREILKKAFHDTMIYRGSTYSNEEIIEILDMISKSENINELWNKYANEYQFANSLPFDIVYQEVKNVIFSLIGII